MMQEEAYASLLEGTTQALALTSQGPWSLCVVRRSGLLLLVCRCVTPCGIPRTVFDDLQDVWNMQFLLVEDAQCW